MKRTKIVATLGPATDTPGMIDEIIQAGVDVVRLNFSHGEAEDHLLRATLIREQAKVHGRTIGILGDLQGPKIRTARFKDGPIDLVKGEHFVLDAALDDNEGTKDSVGITYKQLPDEVVPGNVLVLDDGRIVLEVDSVVGQKITTRVVMSGQLSNNKGINLRGGGLSAPAITEKDLRDIELAAKINVDYLAISFPRTAADIIQARDLLTKAGCSGQIMAKIERAEAIENIDEIIESADAIMVARGDLGVEIGDPELPAVQKMLIEKTRKANKIVLTATQMMESMITNPTPTRAEVFDIANAVLDGTDAVMLSAETASGAYPSRAIESMNRICVSAEKSKDIQRSKHRIDTEFKRTDEAIAMASMYTANHLEVKAIAALTESGSTPLWMSRISSSIPIYALSQNQSTRRRVTLYRGVCPIKFNPMQDEPICSVIELLVKQGVIIDENDRIILTRGNSMGVGGITSTMSIVRAGDWVKNISSRPQ